VHLRCIANSTSYQQLTALLTLKAGQFFCWRLPSEAMQELTEGRSTGIPKIRAATPTSSPSRTTPLARHR